MTAPGPSQAALPTTVYCTGVPRQRDPPIFRGNDEQDVEDWLVEYEIVSASNKWNACDQLTNVRFYLADVASLWFKNHEGEITNWSAFKTTIAAVFGRPAVRRLRAEQRLRSRVQRRDETFTSYIEDVLSLCKRVDESLTERDKIKHIIKGVDDDTFQMLVARNPQTVTDVVQLCQEYDELRKQRVSTRRAAEDTAEVSALVHDVAADHTVLLPHIKQFIREEVARQLSLVAEASAPVTSLDPRLRQVIETQVTQALPPSPSVPTPLTYAAVVARPPAPPVSGAYRGTGSSYPTTLPTYTAPHPVSPPAPSVVNPWRTLDNRPICFACGFVGHIARYCRRRNFQPPDHGNSANYQAAQNPQRPSSPITDSLSPRRPVDSRRSLPPRRRSVSPMLRRTSPAREEN